MNAPPISSRNRIAGVERLYRSLQLAPVVKRQIRRELSEELSNRAALIEKEAKRHESTPKKIEAKQEKLVSSSTTI